MDHKTLGMLIAIKETKLNQQNAKENQTNIRTGTCVGSIS